jgi:hypothetical protein
MAFPTVCTRDMSGLSHFLNVHRFILRVVSHSIEAIVYTSMESSHWRPEMLYNVSGTRPRNVTRQVTKSVQDADDLDFAPSRIETDVSDANPGSGESCGKL